MTSPTKAKLSFSKCTYYVNILDTALSEIPRIMKIALKHPARPKQCKGKLKNKVLTEIAYYHYYRVALYVNEQYGDDAEDQFTLLCNEKIKPKSYMRSVIPNGTKWILPASEKAKHYYLAYTNRYPFPDFLNKLDLPETIYENELKLLLFSIAKCFLPQKRNNAVEEMFSFSFSVIFAQFLSFELLPDYIDLLQDAISSD